MKLVGIANSLIAASPYNIHHTTGKVLEEVGRIVKTDITYLYLYDNKKKKAINTHQWQAMGNKPIPAEYRLIPFCEITGIMKMHLKNRAVLMPPIIPGFEKDALLFTFKKQKTRSIALFPLFFEGRCYGFVGCNQVSSDGCPKNELIETMESFTGMLIRTILRCRDDLNLTQRQKDMQKLTYLSLHDRLTGLYNRAYFDEELKRLQDSREYPITMLYADVDGLKLVNDAFGHDKGDELLKTTANVLQRVMRKPEVLARIGGDEFAALLVNTDEEAAQKVVARIRNEISVYNRGNPEIPLSLSIGTATAEDKSTFLEDLRKEADELMYHDKMLHRRKSSIDLVSKITRAHTGDRYRDAKKLKRLTGLCRALGSKLNLSAQQVSNLVLLAKAQDIGMVGIPDPVLQKPGPLNQEEMRAVRLHSERGYRIALASPTLSGIADLILKHHEWWNGRGYPLGLKNEDIPVECRILAVIDAFVVMTSSTSYKTARSLQEAMEELRHCAGSQFDPQVVKAFIALYREAIQDRSNALVDRKK